MSPSDLNFVPYRQARSTVRNGDLLLFRRRGLISIAGRGDHSHAAKAAWWDDDFRDWRPTCWSDMPPSATAIELVEDRLYSAEEAALFVAGFNGQVLESDKPVRAIAVPITICYLGDAEPGADVCGHAFAQESISANLTEPVDRESLDTRSAIAVPAHDAAVPIAACAASERADLVAHDQSQGFDQSPQRSR
jgi:hypothetical protein